MRHRLKGSKLGRTASHRKATLRSLSIALLTHHRIVTTLTKAKELRRHVEPVINRGKEDTMHNRRQAFSFLQDNATVSKLFDEIGPKVVDRPGGFTRVVKLGNRRGDSAEMAVIELVDYNDSGSENTGSKKKRTRRSGKVSKTTAAKVEEKPVASSDDNPEVTVETKVDNVVDTQENVIDDPIADETSNDSGNEMSDDAKKDK